MISKKELESLLPMASEWARNQEDFIIQNGVPLTDDLKIDAYLIGVNQIEKVRLLKVDTIPTPKVPELKEAISATGLLTPNTIGVTFRYGIYIRSDFWLRRNLVVHELIHTMQYERYGNVRRFLKYYLKECIEIGYPYGPLELEARRIEKEICN
ncbi:MAG: hypothetical protein CMO01_17345 [Thalassobius sp.]|nr:hypothetical protein [Thalassovita sp.]